LRATLKTASLLVHLVWGAGLALFVLAAGPQRFDRERLTQGWNRRLLRILRVDVRVSGEPSPGARLLVANHISWLDIAVLVSVERTRFVAKAEVRDWPIAGQLATGAGSFYIKRGAGGTRQLTTELSAFLRGGGTVCVFPEGTTTAGDSVLRFQPRLFGAAVEAQVLVQPLALRYAPGVAGDAVAAYIGDDDMVSSVRRILREPGLSVEVTYCAALPPQGRDRNELAEAAQTAVTTVIAPHSLVDGGIILPPRKGAIAA